MIHDYSWNDVYLDNSGNIVSDKIYDESGNDITKYQVKLTIHDLSDNIGNQKYKMTLSEDLEHANAQPDVSGNFSIIDVVSLNNDPKSFIFDKSWNYIFLYGKEINDFHYLKKNSLWALNFSATQEIDRQQQADKLRIATLEAEVTTLKSQIASILQRLDNGGL